MTSPATMTGQRVSLRARLVLTLVVLAMAGLIVSGLVINRELDNYLTQRVDQQLVDGIGALGARLNGSRQTHPGPPPPTQSEPFPVGTYGALYTNTGALDAEIKLTFTSSNGGNLDTEATTIYSRPDISAQQIVLATINGGGFLSVDGIGDVGSYRALLQPRGDRVIVVAIPVGEIDATLTQLLWLEIAVGFGVLAVLGILTYVIVRTELRPLARMSQTATRIASGDLGQRVDSGSGGTEVGQLGNALNKMLSRIEEAFAARAASEDRLRRFVGDASHELRTPLTSILGYAEMFRRGADASPEDLATVMRRIEQESQRMSTLVDDLLLLARLDQQRALRSEPADLGHILVDVGLDTQAAYPNHQISVLAQPSTWVFGDEDALRQVFANLAQNACVHTPAGTPVTISLEHDGHNALVSVSDAGPGIPEELADEVFERFTRADSSRARNAGGTGLGLAIVTAIVAAHDGTVRQGPTLGGGATFYVSLPLAVQSVDGPPASA